MSRCFAEDEIERPATALEIAEHVATDAEHYMLSTGDNPTVEQIQDWVDECLSGIGLQSDARRYIRYRFNHAQLREERPVPDEVRAAFDADRQYFLTPLQQFQFYDKYSRFNDDWGRRETWVETVTRAVDFLEELASAHADITERSWRATFALIYDGILKMEVMPSMRLLAMAGAPARRDHLAIYNCSYVPVESLDAFVEALLISMAGCGVGFSVERKYVDRLPRVSAPRTGPAHTHQVADSAEGWAEALSYGLGWWLQGEDVRFDYSQVRPSGAVLRTKGGRASGPEPLKRMLENVQAIILDRHGQQLRPIDAHDIMCCIGDAVISGGVRRTAMISLFDEDDAEMLLAKAPGFERRNPQRWNANNSMVWKNTATMDQAVFVDRFMQMVRSGNGEPGIFSREAAIETMPERRDKDHEFGTNPCGEIQLRKYGLCNLSAAIVRAGDDYNALANKVVLATIIGTIQSLATSFPSLRPIWRKNAEEERLLGVDITGQLDNQEVLEYGAMSGFRDLAVRTNRDYAERLGINPSAAITCVKPSGNTSQLVNCASGLHARWAPYYIRNVRVAGSSPLCRVLRDSGVPMAPENGDDPENPRTWVASFPIKSPEGAITRNYRSAIEQCEWWLTNKLYWTEHNPSVTITYRPNEVIALMGWVWKHRTVIGGMAFLPAFDAQYDQLPYIEIDQAEYERRAAEMPEIDFSKVYRYEVEDHTTAAQEVACSAGICEL